MVVPFESGLEIQSDGRNITENLKAAFFLPSAGIVACFEDFPGYFSW